MKMKLLVALLVVFFAASAHAEEFSAPNGQLGAGLSTDAPEKLRLYGEGTFYYRAGTNDTFGVEIRQTQWAIPLILGGGYRVIPNLEIEARMPIAIGRVSVDVEGCTDPDCQQAIGSLTPGNIYVGANYLFESGKFLLKVGGGLAFGPWTFDVSNDRAVAYGVSAVTNLEDFYLFVPETLGVVVPVRAEYRVIPQLALTGDLALSLFIPLDGGDAELVSTIAPGAGYLTGPWTLGGRLPLFWAMTDDDAQFAFEPFVRYDVGNLFLSTRFSLYLDDPYGFSFDQGNIWAWHFAVGGTL